MPCSLIPNEPCNQARMTAIALNNNGIVKLRRREYAHALEMFRDAVHALKFAASDMNDSHDNEQLHHIMMRASPRTANGTPLIDKSKDFPGCSPTEIISSKVDSTSVLTRLASNTAAPLILPMSIDPEDENNLKHQEFHFEFCNIDMESCILMRNYGLTHLDLANATTEPSRKSLHLDKAYRLLTLAKTVLLRLHEKDVNTEMSETFLLLEMLLEYDLLQTSAQLGLGVPVDEHNEQFQCIFFFIQATDSIFGYRAAPAA